MGTEILSHEKLKTMADVLEEDGGALARGRRGSVIAQQYRLGRSKPKSGQPAPDRFPTNEEVAKAVQQKVAEAVEISRKYRYVAWYSLFVGAYMAVLYLQASAYKSGEVVQTLKKALLPDGVSTKMTFQSEDEVLSYIGEKILTPIWKDPVCGDSKCEWPWEFPAWGRFGCRADCGVEDKTTQIAVAICADFTGHPSISPRVLAANARWNLCLDDPERRKRGEADICWYDTDQGFDQIKDCNIIETMSVIDGNWYISLKGDYAGRVSGAVYDLTNSSSPQRVALSPAWETCKLRKKTQASAGQTAGRRLLEAYTQAHQLGGEAGQQLMKKTVAEVQELLQREREKRLKSLAPQTPAAHASSLRPQAKLSQRAKPKLFNPNTAKQQ